MFPYELTPPLPPHHHQPLFPPFHFSHWRAVDDRVRGGSSVSHLDPVEIDVSGRVTEVSADDDDERKERDVKEKKTIRGARFWGTLDIKTLGGAGFASQVYRYGPYPLHLPRTEYTGISLSVLPDPSLDTTTKSSSPDDDETMKPAKPTRYTLVLKTSPTSNIPKHPRVPAPPRAAQLSYEASFVVGSPPSSSHCDPSSSEKGYQAKGHEVILGWNAFKAFYRGREVKEGEARWVPLDTNSVYEISLMCRSGFGEQEGEFGLIVTSIDGIRKADNETEKEKVVSSNWLSWWWSVFVGWICSWLRWDRGIRLTDEEEGDMDEKAGLFI
ncbi:hypothetical protein IAR55_000898 [Kwoniella newhampshirensis]|uniref:NADH:ubiquinone oxidoreductase intermediate-associated protein 30 domain-containing protein n=1 Tax=Kwoniella newhampshirensis TaxID=1651941 RepID=A0AAW0Z493_9TREE